MQQDAFEVLFCDLCGTSVPVVDLERGVAVRHQAKTIGACCLGVLRKGESPLVVAPPAGTPEVPLAGPAVAASRAGGEGRVLPVAIFLLAALAAVTIYLDQKITAVDEALRSSHEAALQARRSDSEVLQGVGVAMDAVARRADVDALGERLRGLEAAQQNAETQGRQQLEALGQALATAQRELRQAVATADCRPQLDEQRQQLARVLTALADVRLAGGAPAPAAAPSEAAAPKEGGGEPAPATGLPEPLASQVQKLASADEAVRFEAVDALISSKNLAVLPHLVPMAKDADVYVRRLTVEGLRDFRHADAVTQLIASLTDTETTVADTAWNSLKKLTGQKIPFDAAANKEARQRGQQKWQEWWDKNKATFGS